MLTRGTFTYRTKEYTGVSCPHFTDEESGSKCLAPTSPSKKWGKWILYRLVEPQRGGRLVFKYRMGVKWEKTPGRHVRPGNTVIAALVLLWGNWPTIAKPRRVLLILAASMVSR